MEWVNLPFVQGGAVVVLLATIWLIFVGKLVPARHVEELREGDKLTIERQREEISEWRQAWLASDRSKRELASHVSDLMESGKVTEQLLLTITRGSEKGIKP